MAALLIKNISQELHRRIKETAVRHHRSMSREVLVLLEEAVDRQAQPLEWPEPFKGKIQLTQKFINNAKKRGRA